MHSPFQVVSDGTTPIYLRLVDDAGTLKVRAFVNDTLVQVSGSTDLSAYTGVEVFAIIE